MSSPTVRAIHVEVAQQVTDFVRCHAPEPRCLLREGLRRLAREEGDIKALQGSLAPYHRLRLGGYRIIFLYETGKRSRVIRCLFAERRALVYEIFADMVAQRLRESPASHVPSAQARPRPVSYRRRRSRAG